jgi:sugar lactone lactonase YvrE
MRPFSRHDATYRNDGSPRMKNTLMILALLLALANTAQAQQESSPGAADNAGADAVDAEAEFAALIQQETNVLPLVQLAQQARANGDYAIMEQAAARLYELRPYVADFAALLARAHAIQNHKTPAYDVLLRLQRQGLALDLKGDSDFDPIRGTEAFSYIEQELANNANPFGQATGTTQLPRADLLVDGLDWDPKRAALLIGSVTEGAVYVLGSDGTLETLIQANDDNGLLGVFDIAIDAERRHLWVASSAVAHFKGITFQDAGRTGVWKFDLDSGEVLDRFEAPKGAGMMLTNITLAPDGSVFVADSARPAVYQIVTGEREMRRFFQAPRMTSLRGLVVDPDGQFLYFSDYELGLFAVNLAENKTHAIAGTASMNFGGIDDLMWHDGGLVVIQNGAKPHRVAQVTLSDDRRQATAMTPVLSAQPDFQSPAVGTVVGNTVKVLSASHWNLYDAASGQVSEGVELKAPLVLDAALN